MKLAKWMVIAALAAGTDASADPAVSAVYANGAWAGLADGTPVSVEGGTATIGADAFATGDEAVACYGGTTGEGRTLVFLGDGNAASISGFGGLRVRADGMVRIGGALSGVAIEIDARGFEGNTKRVLAAEGGFGDDPSASVVGEGFGWRVLGDGQTLLLVSPRVVDTFVNTVWTEADVQDKFVGDTALVWGGNAFNTLAAAVAALGTNGTLYLDGGSSVETVTLPYAANQVAVLPGSSAVAAGRIAGAGGTLTVEACFSATALSGFSTLTVKAGRGSLDVSEDIRLTENGVLNFDLAGVDIPGLGDGSSYALVGDLSKVQGGPAFVATVDGTEAIGTYNLARGAAGFDGTVALKDPQGNALGTLSPGGAAVETTDRTYALALADSPPGRLVLTVGRPPVLYYDPAGGTNSVCSAYTPYAGETTLASGWWVVTGAMTTEARIAVSGDVHLILRDGASLTAAKGIDVVVDGATTNSLTIWAQSDGDGMGALAASGGYSYAGIGGGGNYGAGGTVTVNGGTVVSEGGEEGGAGIGGGLWGDGCTVAINGGTVVAAGRAAGNAAIGHGAAGSVNGDLVFPGMKVYAAEGGDPVAAADRMAACRGRWAKLAVCDPHAFTAGVDNGDTHSVRCAYCGASNGATEPHAFANGVCASCGATEPPAVSNVVARQRWPWNGLVDVDYEVGGYAEGLEARIVFQEQGGAGRIWVASNFLAGAEPSAEPGFHRATWDTAADGATNVVAGSVAATVALVRPAPCGRLALDFGGLGVRTDAASYRATLYDNAGNPTKDPLTAAIGDAPPPDAVFDDVPSLTRKAVVEFLDEGGNVLCETAVEGDAFPRLPPGGEVVVPVLEGDAVTLRVAHAWPAETETADVRIVYDDGAEKRVFVEGAGFDAAAGSCEAVFRAAGGAASVKSVTLLRDGVPFEWLDYASPPASANGALELDVDGNEFANGAYADGTVMQVANPRQLDNVRNHLGGSFKQIQDIDFAGSCGITNAIAVDKSDDGTDIACTRCDLDATVRFYGGADNVYGWTPIGDREASPFSGTYDGNGCRIAGLVGNAVGRRDSVCALFGWAIGTTAKPAIVTNVRIADDCSFAADLSAAPLVAEGGGHLEIAGCETAGDVYSAQYAAGVLAEAYRDSDLQLKITECTVGARIHGKYVAGVASRCSGGSASLSKCVFGEDGAAIGSWAVGGLVCYAGLNEADSFVIDDCHSLGTLSIPSTHDENRTSSHGGFIGHWASEGSLTIDGQCEVKARFDFEGSADRIGGVIGSCTREEGVSDDQLKARLKGIFRAHVSVDSGCLVAFEDRQIGTYAGDPWLDAL